MKNKEQAAWTKFLDHENGGAGKSAWENDPAALRQREEWDVVRAELGEALRPPPLAHGEFISSRVMEAISREPRPTSPSPGWLLRWALASMGVAAVIAVFWVPDVLRPGSSSGFSSQVVAVRAVHPQISAAAFSLPNDRGVVVWLEGAPYIPAEDGLR